jgi:hypothetical protein
MWRVIFLIVSLNMLVACTKTEDYLRDVVIKHSDLVDPSSAMFRNVAHWRETTKDTWDAWCGEINVKNRMGGYTGWSSFFLEIHEDDRAFLSIQQLEYSHKTLCDETAKPAPTWTPFWRTW